MLTLYVVLLFTADASTPVNRARVFVDARAVPRDGRCGCEPIVIFLSCLLSLLHQGRTSNGTGKNGTNEKRRPFETSVIWISPAELRNLLWSVGQSLRLHRDYGLLWLSFITFLEEADS